MAELEYGYLIYRSRRVTLKAIDARPNGGTATGPRSEGRSRCDEISSSKVGGAIDNRVKCVVSQVPVVSGYRNARRAIAEDRIPGVLTRLRRRPPSTVRGRGSAARDWYLQHLSRPAATVPTGKKAPAPIHTNRKIGLT
jgi:hypothetical protein